MNKNGTVSWKCTHKLNQTCCKSIVLIDRDGLIKREPSAHNHDTVNDLATDKINNMRKRSREELTPILPKVYEDELVPPNPQTAEDMVLTGDWTTTSTHEQFILINDVVKGDRILVFATLADLTRVCESEMIHIDGTFKVCSEIFHQLYIIYSSTRYGILPELFCFLPDKKPETYHRLFFLIQSKAMSLGLSFTPKTIMVDFDVTIHNVIRLLLPNTLIKGCFFHFAQLIFRKLRSIKISNCLKSNDDIRKWFRMFLGMASMPIPHLQRAFNAITSINLPKEHQQECNDFHHYFMETWLCGNYPGEMWTYFNSTLPRTNNSCKGYISRLSRRAMNAHLNIFELIKVLKHEHINKAVSILQLEAGHCNKKKRKLDRDIAQRLREYGLSYLVCDMDIETYLLKCGDVARPYLPTLL